MSFYKKSKSTDRRRSNRYRKCDVLTDLESGEAVLSSREVRRITVSSNDIIHTVTYRDSCRLDLIAHQYYGNALLWWVVAEANGVTDPFQEFPVGFHIRIPSLESLYGSGGILT